MTKAIVFDFGQTLVDSADGFRFAEKVAKQRIFTDLSADSDADSWADFLMEYRRIRKDFHQNSHFSRVDIWQAVYSRFGRTPEPARLLEWETDYWTAVKNRTNPFPETIPVLDKLSRIYKLAIISNTQGQTSGEAHRLALFPDLEGYFQTIIIAGEGDVPPKPDKKPFELCLESLGIIPSEAAFVGDDWRMDIRGAEQAGMIPIWLQHHTVKRSWPEVDSLVPVITSLMPLLDLVSILTANSM